MDGPLTGVGRRLREVRRERRLTLADVSACTGVSVSTLSRLEAGGRRPTLELLLSLARAYGVTLDDLVAAPSTDPRVPLRPVVRDGLTLTSLSRRPGGTPAYRLTLPPLAAGSEPRLRGHEGHEWLYVLDGRLRLLLGEHDLVLGPGEVAELDPRTPHWFGAAGAAAVELLGLFGTQGERAHLRARPTRRAG